MDALDHGVTFRAGLRRVDDLLLSYTDPQTLEACFGAPTVALHRVDLMHLLLDQVGDVVQGDKRLDRYDQDGDRIRAHFTNGSSAQGDLLVGADGIHWAVRGQMLPDAEPDYRGYPAWRGVATFDHAHDTWGETWGRGARFGVIPLSEGRIYWFATANRPADSPPADHRAAYATCSGNGIRLSRR